MRGISGKCLVTSPTLEESMRTFPAGQLVEPIWIRNGENTYAGLYLTSQFNTNRINKCTFSLHVYACTKPLALFVAQLRKSLLTIVSCSVFLPY